MLVCKNFFKKFSRDRGKIFYTFTALQCGEKKGGEKYGYQEKGCAQKESCTQKEKGGKKSKKALISVFF